MGKRVVPVPYRWVGKKPARFVSANQSSSKASQGGVGDAVAPTVTITSSEVSPTAAATIPLTITFSEAVTGFVVGDITVVGCTLGALGGSGAVYTVTATPTEPFVNMTVDIAAGVCTDAAGNGNTAASQFGIQYDPMTIAGDDVAVYRDYSGSAYVTYNIFKHLYNNRYWQIKIGNSAPTVGANAQRLNYQYISDLWLGFNTVSTPAVTQSGFSVIAAAAIGGKLMYATTSAKYVEAVCSNCTAVGAILNWGATDGGVVVVSIDGDNTLADLLVTAQNLVDAGTIPSTALVANGGTLNPTDRCIDSYNLTNNYAFDYPGAGNHFMKFTTSLSLGSHTVRITTTAYKNTASSAAKFYINVIACSSTSKRTSSGGFIFGEKIEDIDLANTWDISYSFKPTGASGYQFLGHDGQAKIVTALSVSVDGGADVGNWLQATGNTAILTQSCSIRHPEIGGGATVLGTFDIIYTINKTTGMNVSHTVTWATSGLIQGYPCMMALTHSIYDRYDSVGQTAKDLTVADNSVNLNNSGQYAWAWDFDGGQAAVMYFPLTTVDSWVNADASPRLFWMDISPTTWKKAYAVRYRLAGSINTFSNLQVITSSAQYRVHYFAGGANAVFG